MKVLSHFSETILTLQKRITHFIKLFRYYGTTQTCQSGGYSVLPYVSVGSVVRLNPLNTSTARSGTM
jgi:hypothetical protein